MCATCGAAKTSQSQRWMDWTAGTINEQTDDERGMSECTVSECTVGAQCGQPAATAPARAPFPSHFVPSTSLRTPRLLLDQAIFRLAVVSFGNSFAQTPRPLFGRCSASMQQDELAAVSVAVKDDCRLEHRSLTSRSAHNRKLKEGSERVKRENGKRAHIGVQERTEQEQLNAQAQLSSLLLLLLLSLLCAHIILHSFCRMHLV